MATVGSGVALFNFQIKQGADLTISMTWLNDAGAAMNLTGYAMELTIRAYVGSTVSLLTISSATSTGSYIALGGTAGTISLIFDHTDTGAFVVGGFPQPFGQTQGGIRSYALGVYDLQYTDASGNVGFLLEGSVTLDPQVTV
jgi:hypothetical protein